jgi:hypothetical protein
LQGEEHWTIRRWVSTVSQEVAIIWQMRKTNLNATGVSGYLFHNGTEIDTAAIEGNDGTGVKRVKVVTVDEGDLIELALGPTGPTGDRTDGSDGSANRLAIESEVPDLDKDGVPDHRDNCQGLANPTQANADGDSFGDDCDNCPSAANDDQADRNVDGIGDACEAPWIADSYFQWSTTGTQGENHWWNGYYNLTQDADSSYSGDSSDFTEFDPVTEFVNGAWDLKADHTDGLGPWTYQAQGDVHPNGTNNGDEHWVIRRWESDQNVKAEITWHMRKPTTAAGGDGVTGILFLNGVALDQATIHGTDIVGVTRTVVANLKTGDFVDLALTPTGVCGAFQDWTDGSFDYLTIRQTTADPLAVIVLADSMGGWSVTGTQGDNGWFYGYYDVKVDVETGDGVYAADEFTEFLNDGSGIITSDDTIGAWKTATNHWDGNAWDLQVNYWDPDPNVTGDEYGHGPWTGIGCSTTHPAGNGGGDPEVQWSVRRWVSNFDGSAKIEGYFRNDGNCTSDGTVLRIFKNGSQVYSGRSTGNPVHFSVAATLASGDTVDFAIDPDGAGNLATGGLAAVIDGCDTTTFLATISTTGSVGPEPKKFYRADPNNDGSANITDGIYILNYLFLGGPAPTCRESADPNNDKVVNITDGIYVLNYLFLGGPAPLPPGPPGKGQPCGPDTDAPGTPGDLGCEVYTKC